MSDQEQPINEPPPAFDPNAELDYLLAGAKVGTVSIVTPYQALLRAPRYAMFDRAMDPENLDAAGNALLFDTADMGRLMVLFTAPEYSEKVSADLGEFGHPVQLSGEYIVSVLAEDTGMMLSPGHDFGMKLSATGPNRLRGDFGPQASAADGGAGPGAGGMPRMPGGGTPFPSFG